MCRNISKLQCSGVQVQICDVSGRKIIFPIFCLKALILSLCRYEPFHDLGTLLNRDRAKTSTKKFVFKSIFAKKSKVNGHSLISCDILIQSVWKFLLNPIPKDKHYRVLLPFSQITVVRSLHMTKKQRMFR